MEIRSARLLAILLALNLGDCTGARAPLNPAQLVSGEETDMAVQLFMQATILLARYYGYQTLEYEVVREKSIKAGFNPLPFMPPQSIAATPGFKRQTLNPSIPAVQDDKTYTSTKAYQAMIEGTISYNGLVKYYISTGHRASQIICRNYLQNLEERNRYIQFLQDEFGVFNSVANLVLAAADANGALKSSFAISKVLVDGTLDKYQEYRFLSVDYEEARVMVETAQNVLADYYFGKVDGAKPVTDSSGRKVYNKIFTFSDALNAVSVIEAQCTRAGIRRLLAKAVYATPTNMAVDPVSGTITFLSNTKAGEDGAKTAKEAGAKAPENKSGELNKSPPVAAVAPATAAASAVVAPSATAQ